MCLYVYWFVEILRQKWRKFSCSICIGYESRMIPYNNEVSEWNSRFYSIKKVVHKELQNLFSVLETKLSVFYVKYIYVFQIRYFGNVKINFKPF